MLSNREFMELARANGVSPGAVEEILRCLRPCVVINKDKVGKRVGRWKGEYDTKIVLECAALPHQHLDLGLGLPDTGSLLMATGCSPRWSPEPADRLLPEWELEYDGDLHGYAAWTHPEWWAHSEDLHPKEMHPALEEAMAEYRRCVGPMELLGNDYAPSDSSLQLGGSLLRTPQDPPELDLVDLGDDWDWSFDDEVLRKVSVWKLFGNIHNDNCFEFFWLIHQTDTTVDRYDEIVWVEQGT
ncbi:hypothetical protein ACIF9R_30900 [Streptomyces sp. NPDC086080]|uniref:hypothetical protein n=1 Tax=Streptomyces sp. NPDC086080 TaxID=3365748 RepID=UPI0037D18F8E